MSHSQSPRCATCWASISRASLAWCSAERACTNSFSFRWSRSFASSWSARLRSVTSWPWAMVATGVFPSGAMIVAEFHSTVRTEPSTWRMSISTVSHGLPSSASPMSSIERQALSEGKRSSGDVPMTSLAFRPVMVSKARLNRMIRDCGLQMMIGALARSSRCSRSSGVAASSPERTGGRLLGLIVLIAALLRRPMTCPAGKRSYRGLEQR